MLRRLTLAAVALAAGCGKNPTVSAVERMADEICACPDAACAREVHARRMAELLEKHRDAKGTDGDRRAIEAAGKRMQGCMERLK